MKKAGLPWSQKFLKIRDMMRSRVNERHLSFQKVEAAHSSMKGAAVGIDTKGGWGISNQTSLIDTEPSGRCDIKVPESTIWYTSHLYTTLYHLYQGN